MRVLVYHDRVPAFGTVIAGLNLAGHYAAARTTRMFLPGEAERADMVVVNWDDPRGMAIISAYRQRGTLTTWLSRAVLPDYLHMEFDGWGDYVPPFPCPADRANDQNLRVRLVCQDGLIRLADGSAPLATLAAGTDFHAWLNRLAYSNWSMFEFSTGAPFRWLLDALAGVWVPVLPSQTATTPPQPGPASSTGSQPNPGHFLKPGQRKRR